MIAAKGRVDVRVLGTVSISVADKPIELSPVERHIVALLAVARNDGLTADQLANELWLDTLPNSWQASLRNNVSRLNKKVLKALEAEADDQPDSDPRLIVGRNQRRLSAELASVDLWLLDRWLESPESVEPDDVTANPSVLAGSPFLGVEVSSRLETETSRVTAARRDIVANWAERGNELPNQMLAELRRLNLEHPFEDELSESVAILHMASDEGGELAAHLDALEQAGAVLTPALLDLRANSSAVDRVGQRLEREAKGRSPTQSPRIAQLSAGSLVGRDALLEDLLGRQLSGQPGVVLHGDSGIGKTRLAAEVASRLGEAGFSTAYAVADEHAFGSLQPFLDAFRGIGAVVEPHLDALHDPDVQARCRREVIDHLEERYADHPLCVVMDDVHWLDDPSAALLMALCRAQLANRVFIVAVGRAGEPSARWPKWQGELRNAGLTSFKIASLDHTALVNMVNDRFDGLSRVQASDLADETLELSSGIPEVAQWLLDQVDPVTMEIQIDGSGDTGYSAMVAALAPEVARNGALASVLGLQFSGDDLAELAGWPTGETADRDTSADNVMAERLGALVETGLLVEPAAPGRYRFAHIMAAQAFDALLGPRERIELHARAFKLFDNPLRRAWHAERAAAALGPEATVEAMLESARLQFTAGSYRAASAAVKRAMDIDRSLVPLADRVMNLEAKERNSQPEPGERLALTTEAANNGDWDLALRAAAAGLPLSESLAGDPARVRVLQMIEPDRLDDDSRMRLHLHLSRQHMLLGQAEEAVTEADKAWAIAASPEQKGWAWIGRRLASGIGRADQADEWWPSPSEIESEILRFELHQAQVISTIASGGSHERFDLISSHVAMADDTSFPHIQWFARVFLATAETDRGNHDLAVRTAESAHQLGMRAGLPSAAGAYLTQQFVWQFHRRRHGDFYPLFADGPPDEYADNVIFKACITACHHAWAVDTDNAEEQTKAKGRVADLYNSARRSPFDVAAIGLTADVIAACEDDRYTSWANERLQTRRGAYIPVASASANLGPTTGLMAKLQTVPQVAAGLWHQAIDQVDRDGLPLWQISTRLDLAATLDADDPARSELADHARKLATTPWLTELVEARIGQNPG